MSNIDNFLKKISMIESSGGKNTNHKTMESGIHKGQAAAGRFGLMPNTIKEIINRERLAGTIDSELETLDLMEHDDMKAYVESDPELEMRLAKTLAERVLSKTDNEEQAAYAWNMGHNLSSDKIIKRDYLTHPYVKKFLEESKNDPVVENVQEVPDDSEIKLSSEQGAPLPPFANESGKVKETPNAIQTLMEQYDKGVTEFNDKAFDVQLPDYDTGEMKKLDMPLKIDPLGMLGSIKNVAGAFPKRQAVLKAGQFGDDLVEATNVGKQVPDVAEVVSPLQKKILSEQEKMSDSYLGLDEFFAKQKKAGKTIPASADELLDPDLTKVKINNYNTKMPNDAKLEKLDGSGLSSPPVATMKDENMLIKNLRKKIK